MSNEHYVIIMILLLLCWAVFIMWNQAIKIGYYEQKLRNRKPHFGNQDWSRIQRMIDTNFPLIKKWFYE